MRFSDYIRVSFRALGRQAGRTALTVVAMAISATILMTLAAMSLGLEAAARSTLTPDDAMSDVVITPTRTAATAGIFGGAQEVSQGDNTLTDATFSSLRATPHVQSAVPLADIWEFKSFVVAESDKNFVAQTAGITEITRKIAAGSQFSADTAHEVILGDGYAKELGLQPGALVGKTITFTTQNGYIGGGAQILPAVPTLQQAKDYANHATQLTAMVIGVLAPGQDDSRVYIPMGWARQIRTLRTATSSGEQRVDQIAKDGYSSIVVRADDPAHVQDVVDAANKLGVGAVSTLSQLKKIMQFASVMWVGLGSIAAVTLLAGALGIVNTMLTAVAEQRYAIAVWRASGATKGVIARMFILQAALMGLFGGALGAGLSYAAVTMANQQLRLLLAAQHLVVIDVATLSWWLAALGIGTTVLFAVFAGTYPAWRAARQDPAVALAGN